MEIEVLVVTMNQKDLSLHSRMNLKCDALIANQCGQCKLEQEEYQYGKVRMICSDTIGVGINRNLALDNAEGDILVFADDDIVYYDSDLDGVCKAFENLPDADVICFGIDMTRNGEVFDKRRCEIKKLHLWNALKFGTCRMAVRREAVEKHDLRFSTLFGGGSLYSSGEDSLFLRDCFKAGLKVYSHSYVLGACAKDTSSWFEGFNEKYLYDKGAWIACAFPRIKHIIKWYFVWRFSKRAEKSYIETARLINKGIAGFKLMKKYED